ncbi:OadG family protein [Sporanaerobacter acetigenes]|uniref:OadG family protein n=1 Tax=Sporanaerobacter acetigenes TaxID=165813 RepID=UPI003323D108
MLGDSVTIGQSLMITVFSMAIVFIALLVISYLIDGLRAIASKDNGKKTVEEKLEIEEKKDFVEENSNEENEEELVAVIAAAIAASQGIDVSDVKISSIKRVPQNTPVWSRMGRQEQIFGRL